MTANLRGALLLLALATGCKCKSDAIEPAPVRTAQLPTTTVGPARPLDAGSTAEDAQRVATELPAALPTEELDAGAIAQRDVAAAAQALAERHRRVAGVEVGRALSVCGNGAPIVRYAAPGVPRGAPIRACDDFANDIGVAVPRLTIQAVVGPWVQLSDGDWVLRDALSTAEVLVVGDREYLLQGHGNTFTLEGGTLTLSARSDPCEGERCGEAAPAEGEPSAPPSPALIDRLAVGDAGSPPPQLEVREVAQCCT